jgi:beta-xylosidase
MEGRLISFYKKAFCEVMKMKINPIIYSDYPDPDIIRVGDTYYMASTTMHFMPGCVILRSYDLVNWEHLSYVYDELDSTSAQCLAEGNIYGQGMWAPSFRYYKGIFYLCFAANDTQKTYLYTTTNPEDVWTKSFIEGFYHDPSLLFDEDDRIYLTYGNKVIYLLELNEDLTGPRPDGLKRILIEDKGDVILGYEGAHLQKHQGQYYLFVINWPRNGNRRRLAHCFIADSLEGEFTGKCIIDDDLEFHNQGVAQGGMIDTPEGDWYLFMFQDRGAVGRVPIMIPMSFKDGFPIVKNGKIPQEISIRSTRPGYKYEPLVDDDDFNYGMDSKLKKCWQFNHIPNADYWSITERLGAFRLKSNKICPNLTHSSNTLTQRTTGPQSTAVVTVEGTELKAGDYAGICALQGSYGAIALTKQEGQYYLVMMARPAEEEAKMGKEEDNDSAIEYARIPIESSVATLKISIDFEELKDEVQFFYQDKNEWMPLGICHQLYFKLDHFVGCRFGLFLFSTQHTGGIVDFLNFKYSKKNVFNK